MLRRISEKTEKCLKQIERNYNKSFFASNGLGDPPDNCALEHRAVIAEDKAYGYEFGKADEKFLAAAQG